MTLTAEERQALRELPIKRSRIGRDEDIVREGDRPGRSFVLLEGYVFSYKLTGDSRRQMLAFHIPGDIPDLQSVHLKTLDNSAGTLTDCEIGYIEHSNIRGLCHANPRVADALWRESLITASIQREWLLNVGRREGASRIAHLLCEWFVRMRSVGLTQGGGCDLPLTQSELGDAVGFSAVHVNRVLQELRARGLITMEGGRLEILNWNALVTLGDFDPTYLHMGEDKAG